MLEWSRRDIIFWINAFGWSYDPRQTGRMGTMTPFVTFAIQDDVIVSLLEVLFNREQEDALVEKTRDVGASWIFCFIFAWLWLFHGEKIELFMMSRKQDLVDDRTSDSLFGKIDMILKHLPAWMLPKGYSERLHRNRLYLENPVTGTTIKGESTSSESGVGGRYFAMFFDEFSKVPEAETIFNQSGDCTEHRLFNGTPTGTHTTFYRLRNMKREDGMVVLRMHWTMHPWKADGLYFDENGKPWSPWYLKECKRRGWNQIAIAQELDIDYRAAGGLFFDESEILELVQKFSREPDQIGSLKDGELVVDQGGLLRLWFKGPRPPRAKYAIGCDVAAGVKGRMATPSCISVANKETGEKLGEWQAEEHRPEQFAVIARDIAEYFYGAQINFENAGPGAQFRDVLMRELAYGNVYLRRKSEKTLRPIMTDEIGFAVNRESKRALVESYRYALSFGRFVNRSARALWECLEFVFDTNGGVVHSAERAKDDLPGVDVNHGDQVIADALANLLVRESGMQRQPGGQAELERDPPWGSPAWLDKEFDSHEDDDEMDGW